MYLGLGLPTRLDVVILNRKPFNILLISQGIKNVTQIAGIPGRSSPNVRCQISISIFFTYILCSNKSYKQNLYSSTAN